MATRRFRVMANVGDLRGVCTHRSGLLGVGEVVVEGAVLFQSDGECW